MLGADSTVPSSPRPAADLQGEGLSLLEALVDSGLMKSKGEARRMIRQSAVRVNDELISDEMMALTPGHVDDGRIRLQVGKRKHHHLLIEG